MILAGVIYLRSPSPHSLLRHLCQHKVLHGLVFSLIKVFPAGTQYSRNIRCVFPQRCNVRDIQGKFREHFKGKDFFKVLDGKVVFVLKVYDLIIANVDLLANSSNHEVMFPEYSRNIPRIPFLITFQGYSRNIVKL